METMFYYFLHIPTSTFIYLFQFFEFPHLYVKKTTLLFLNSSLTMTIEVIKIHIEASLKNKYHRDVTLGLYSLINELIAFGKTPIIH